ncbi:hypothetical protein RvY_08253-2 [Ramazzottius varieornatus]|uniref:Chromo domain-containing protein n=1 Tax=Ramazzottius varieornatus TaxID=947166 RepID=A0A1D1V7J3_RAMVA|nr:hypothetical protein RvY_08253-2 [Ramazzottius varieornatus]
MSGAPKEREGSLSHQMDRMGINNSDASSVLTTSTSTNRDSCPAKKRRRPRKLTTVSVGTEYEVEKVLDKRIGEDGVTSYKILWKDYPEEEASWVVRELMDCPEKIEEYEKKDREYRYRKRASNIGENWQTEDFSSLAQAGAETAIEPKTEPEAKVGCTRGAVSEMESQMLAEYLELVNAGREVVTSLPSWKRCFGCRKPLPEEEPLQALQAVEDEKGDLFLEMQWQDGLTKMVPFPVALKLYPMIFLPWFESYLNAEAAKEGCRRDDFLGVDWETKLAKSREDLKAEAMEVDEPTSAETEHDVPASNAMRLQNSTNAIDGGCQSFKPAEATVSPRARLILKLPRPLPKPLQHSPTSSGPNSPAYLSNERDLLLIQDSIVTPPVPPCNNPSHPLTVAANSSPLVVTTAQPTVPVALPHEVVATEASKAPSMEETLMSRVTQQGVPLETVIVLPQSVPLVGTRIITPVDFLLATSASPSPKRSPRPPKQGNSTPKRTGRPPKLANSSPLRSLPPRNILPKPVSGAISAIEGSALKIPERPLTASRPSASEQPSLSSVSSAREATSNFQPFHGASPSEKPSSSPKSAETKPENCQPTSEQPVVGVSSSLSTSVVPTIAASGFLPPEEEKPKVPKAEDGESYRAKRELYLRYVPLLNRCIAKLRSELAEKEQELVTLETLLRERPEAREAVDTITSRKNKLKAEMETIQHPIKRLVLLVTAGKDQPTLRVLEKCVNVVERSIPWFENYIGEAEARKYFSHISAPAAANPHPATSMSELSNGLPPADDFSSTITPHDSKHPMSLVQRQQPPSGVLADWDSLKATFGKFRAADTCQPAQSQSAQQSNLLNTALTQRQEPPKYTGYRAAVASQQPPPPQALLPRPTGQTLHKVPGATIQSVVPHSAGSHGGPRRPSQPLLRYAGPPVPQMAVRQLIGTPPLRLAQPAIVVQRPTGPVLLPIDHSVQPAMGFHFARKAVTRPHQDPPQWAPKMINRPPQNWAPKAVVRPQRPPQQLAPKPPLRIFPKE